MTDNDDCTTTQDDARGASKWRGQAGPNQSLSGGGGEGHDGRCYLEDDDSGKIWQDVRKQKEYLIEKLREELANHT
jgi:hypothetical protein